MIKLSATLFSKSFSSIIVSIANEGVQLITLNRPKALNALSDGLMTELGQALRAADADPSIRAVVLTGSDKAFAAGADIKEMNSRSYEQVLSENMLSTWQDLSKTKKPVIAAVNGYALGGGCELAMMCDIIIAGDSAVFGQPEVTIGTVPGAGGTQRLIRAVGKSRAMEWILTGKKFTALEAESAGLVSRVVPSTETLKEAIALATEIAKHSIPVIQIAKECVNQAYEQSLSEGLNYERQKFHATWSLDDRKEGMTAFIEKRSPDWVDH